MVKDMAKGIKISDFSKDFSMKSKDVIEKFKTINIEKTTSGTVSDEEFAAFMQHVTLGHQISDLEAYRSGKITIKIAKEKPKAEAPKAEAPKTEAPKTEVKTEAPKTEAPKTEAPKAPKAEPKRETEKPQERRPEARPQQDKRPDQRPQGAGLPLHPDRCRDVFRGI